MRVRDAAAPLWLLCLLLVLATLAGGCQQSIFRQYEYEEEIYLKLDGSATVIVNASVPALVALRGFDLDPEAPVDRDKVRTLYESADAHVVRVSNPWRRKGRRFVQVRLDVEDIRRLGSAPPFTWSSYSFVQQDAQFLYRQTMGASAAGASGAASASASALAPAPAAGKTMEGGWDGSEMIAVRMHLPSRIEYHNATSKKVDRGNIVSWEQPLRDRLAGRPLEMEVRMQTQSILNRTLTIFGLAMVAAFIVLAAIVFWVKQKGRAAAA
jgi:hypothetical protein